MNVVLVVYLLHVTNMLYYIIKSKFSGLICDVVLWLITVMLILKYFLVRDVFVKGKKIALFTT